MASNSSSRRPGPAYLCEAEDELKCAICLEVATDPLQHEECGKLFCKECIEKHGKDKPCPNCASQGSNYYKDRRSQKHILALPVRCSNVSSKCEWVGTVATLEDHMSGCEYSLLPCPKQCRGSDDEIGHLMRKDLDEHLENDCPNRDFECKHCGKKATFVSITQDHDNICKKKLLPCPNADCIKSLQRRSMKSHLGSCRFTELPCKYRRVGCRAKMQRHAMVVHESDNDNFHLNMALDKITAMESSLANRQPLTFVLEEFEKKRSESGAYFSPAFYTSPGGYRLAIKVLANGYGEGHGSDVAVFVFILKGNYDRDLEWPFVGTVACTLLNQLKDRSHHTGLIHFTRAGNRSPGSNWGFDKFITHSELAYNEVKDTHYLKDDTLFFRVSVEVAEHKTWLECTAM